MSEKTVSKGEKERLLKKLGSLRRDISSLKAELNNLNNQKESFFEKKGEVTKKIISNIKRIKEFRSKRDELTKKVKENKEKKKKNEKNVFDKIKKAKELNKRINEIEKKHNIRGDPSKIKESIEKMELNIETEVMSFSKEKQAMEKIKNLKKRYNDAIVVSGVWSEMNKVSESITTLKKENNELHKKIQNMAKESQNNHEGMVRLSNEIDSMRKDEHSFASRFNELKTRFNDINSKLKAKLIEMNRLNEEFARYNIGVKETKKKKDYMQLRDKGIAVEEKLKKGGKLTTEDLLVLQGLDEKE